MGAVMERDHSQIKWLPLEIFQYCTFCTKLSFNGLVWWKGFGYSTEHAVRAYCSDYYCWSYSEWPLPERYNE
jgi:hypothetical protein